MSFLHPVLLVKFYYSVLWFFYVLKGFLCFLRSSLCCWRIWWCIKAVSKFSWVLQSFEWLVDDGGRHVMSTKWSRCVLTGFHHRFITCGHSYEVRWNIALEQSGETRSSCLVSQVAKQSADTHRHCFTTLC